MIIIVEENTQQNNPAIATVVNFGVSFRHLKLTENTENPIADVIPKTSPNNEFFPSFPKAIVVIPNVATKIEIQTLVEIFSFKKRKPNKAVINGIAAKHSRVIAAVVFVIDQIKVIIAAPKPTPPIKPEIPTFK